MQILQLIPQLFASLGYSCLPQERLLHGFRADLCQLQVTRISFDGKTHFLQVKALLEECQGGARLQVLLEDPCLRKYRQNHLVAGNS